jgi:hypothetical protein
MNHADTTNQMKKTASRSADAAGGESRLSRAVAGPRAQNEPALQMIYDTVHDLKSPLIIIEGYLHQVELALAAGRIEGLRELIAPVFDASAKMRGRLDALGWLAEAGGVPAERPSAK